MSDTFPGKLTYWPSASISNSSVADNLARGFSSSGNKTKLDTDSTTIATPQSDYEQISPRKAVSNSLHIHTQPKMFESVSIEEISKCLIVRTITSLIVLIVLSHVDN
jgi:hypothetical protein